MTTEQLLIIIAAEIAALAVAAALIFAFVRRAEKRRSDELGRLMSDVSRDITEHMAASRRELNEAVATSMKTFAGVISDAQRTAADSQDKRLAATAEALAVSLESLRRSVNEMMQRIDERVMNMAKQNDDKLEKMRQTVDEKLQKTLEERLGQSFRLVSERLEMVSKGLGEMQVLAKDVGNLQGVLSSVKSRGVLGEVQLEAIISEFLTAGQYDKNVATVSNSKNRVEFAVKLPTEGGGFMYLPIDAKFPGDTYSHLRDAYDSGDPVGIENAAKALVATIKSEANDIRTKYISPPETTDFAIMFLPFEGLYAEVVNRGVLETLQREQRVMIAGPSTIAALLNSLQMSFRSFAIQKRSGDVWKVLGAVKTEFETFADVLASTRNKLRQADDELEKLVGTRTNVMRRKLKEVEALDEFVTADLLGTALPEAITDGDTADDFGTNDTEA